MTIDREVREECLDLARAEVPRMPVSEERDEPTHPMQVRLLGGQTHAPGAHSFSSRLE